MTHPDLHPTNHALWQLIQRRVATPIPMSQIAAELGFDVDELCAWIMAYRRPKKRSRYVNRDSEPAITWHGAPIRDHYSMSQAAERYANWKRAHDAAAKAIK